MATLRVRVLVSPLNAPTCAFRFLKELALRYVLEDGKLNVCLRNLVEWRDFDRMRRESDVVDEKPSVTFRRATCAGHYILGIAFEQSLLT